MWTAAWRSPIMRRMRGFLPAAVEGGIPLVRIMRIRIYIYVDQDQGQDEMIKRKRTRTRTRMSIYYIVPHQVATPARLLTSWTKKTARERYFLIKDFLFHKRITRWDENLIMRMMATIGWYTLSTIQVLAAGFCVFVVYSFVWKGACLFVCLFYPFFILFCGKVSTCWSPGQPDGDCPNFGLCCFDGCANTCGEGDDAINFCCSTDAIIFCSTRSIMIRCCSSSIYSFQNTRRRSPNREQLLLQLATAMTSQRYRIQCWTNLFLKTKVTCMLITLRSPSQWDQRQLLEERQQEGQQRRYRVCTRDLLGAAGDSQTGIETKTPCYSDLQFSTKNTQFIWPYQC